MQGNSPATVRSAGLVKGAQISNSAGAIKKPLKETDARSAANQKILLQQI